MGLPGSAEWRVSLGRNWSHEFAERIVLDPDVGTDATVWLLTRWGTFRKFTDLVGGIYTSAAPSDEYRTLRRTIGGWELEDLEGTVVAFDEDGLWQSTTDRNGNAFTNPTPTDPQLTRVNFPDGRWETFGYDASGRLTSITQNGVNGPPEIKVWNLTWLGDDLIRIGRPDGTAWEFEYGDTLNPGHMTRMYLVPTSGNRRVESAWEYDMWGNVTATWKGAESYLPPTTAVDVWQFSYDDPTDPTVTTIIDPMGVQSTRTYERDTVSRKPRVTEIEGSCSVCGSSPETTWAYTDPNHPLLPETITDADGIETVFTYDTNGRVTSKTEGANVTGHPHLPRITEWQYNEPAFPGLPTLIEGPTYLFGTHSRTVSMEYDPLLGNLLERTVEGNEGTGTFLLTTEYSGYNAAGRVGTVNPPGFGLLDETDFFYEAPGRNGMLLTKRTDPLVGDTVFQYDEFNRQVRVVDPNGAKTDTQYDALNRVTRVIHRDPNSPANPEDAPGTGDVTTRYLYDAYGNLGCKISSEGVGTQYLYEAATGRLIEERVGSAKATPTATSCLDISSSLRAHRRVWTLDGAGHRKRETLEHSNGSASSWIVQAETHNVYSTMCHLDQVKQGPDASPLAVTDYGYDCRGNLQNIWDPNHPKATFPLDPSTTYFYDEINRMTAVEQPWGGSGGGTVTTAYEYDVQDHLTKVTDGEGTVTSYVYSDRDLMTQQTSEVSGTTTYTYNEHGELTTELDARGIQVSRTVNEADQVTFVDYPGTNLDVTYVWGDQAATDFEIGRLREITRGGHTIEYDYDRFGRLLRDGDLEYSYDDDGRVENVTYPGDLVATYTYTAFSREKSLTVQEGTSSSQNVVKVSPAPRYKAFGPLEYLLLEIVSPDPDREINRGFDARYAPTSINLRNTTGSSVLYDWTYGTDAVGNVTSIAQVTPAGTNRTFGYQDWQYYLTSSLGPWLSQVYAYDRAGNRRDESGTLYMYQPNAASTGVTSELDHVVPGFADSFMYTFDNAGYLDQIFHDGPGNDDALLDATFDAAGLFASIERDDRYQSDMFYDGRGFLRELTVNTNGGWVRPTYSSAGVLHSLERTDWSGGPIERINILYFAGQPIALWKKVGAATATFTYLLTDHLGTPIASIKRDESVLDWYGGFDPFGEDWQAKPNDASSKGIFLRMPGQWEDTLWGDATYSTELFYNVHRWYEPATGRYTGVDPLIALQLRRDYQYVVNRPLVLIDPMGLEAIPGIPDGGKPCSEVSPNPTPNRECCDIPYRAFSNVIRRRLLYCANSGNDKDVTGKLLASGANLGGNPVPEPWIVPDPDGNKCVDECRCFHERYHRTQVRTLGERPFRKNELECQAYGAQLECLKRKTGFSPQGVPEPVLKGGL